MQEAGFKKVEAYVLRRKNALLCNGNDFGTLQGDGAYDGDVVCERWCEPKGMDLAGLRTATAAAEEEV